MGYNTLNDNGYRGNFKENPLKKTVQGANKYLPVHIALSYGVVEKTTLYSKTSIESSSCYVKANSIRNILYSLANSLTPTRIRMYDKNFFFLKGTILDENGNILLMTVFESKDWTENRINARKILLYSSTFFTDPKLAAFNRRLQKELLKDCYEKGMEVRVLTPSIIEANTFAELFEVKKTDTILGLDTYMKTVLPNFLHTEEEDTFVEERRQEELLSIEEEALLYDSDSTITISSAHTVGFSSPASHQLASYGSLYTSGTGSGVTINASDVPNIFANYPQDNIVTYVTREQQDSASIVRQVQEEAISRYNTLVDSVDRGILQQMSEDNLPFVSGTIELVDDTE